MSHCCGLVVAFACGRGACWACWGTVCLRSWAFCMREWRVVALLGYLFPAELGELLEGLERLRIRSHCCGRGVPLSHCCGLVVAFACGRARGMDAITTERYAGKRPARHFKRFKGLKPVKRQP